MQVQTSASVMTALAQHKHIRHHPSMTVHHHVEHMEKLDKSTNTDRTHRETRAVGGKTNRFTKSTYHVLHGGNRLRAKERNTEGQRLERQ